MQGHLPGPPLDGTVACARGAVAHGAHPAWRWTMQPCTSPGLPPAAWRCHHKSSPPDTTEEEPPPWALPRLHAPSRGCRHCHTRGLARGVDPGVRLALLLWAAPSPALLSLAHARLLQRWALVRTLACASQQAVCTTHGCPVAPRVLGTWGVRAGQLPVHVRQSAALPASGTPSALNG